MQEVQACLHSHICTFRWRCIPCMFYVWDLLWALYIAVIRLLSAVKLSRTLCKPHRASKLLGSSFSAGLSTGVQMFHDSHAFTLRMSAFTFTWSTWWEAPWPLYCSSLEHLRTAETCAWKCGTRAGLHAFDSVVHPGHSCPCRKA